MSNSALKRLSDLELLALSVSAAVTKKYSIFKNIVEELEKRNFNNNKIYEALLQSYLFAGFPSALVSLQKFQKLTGYLPSKKHNNSLSGISGVDNAKIIYGNKLSKLISNISSFSPELAEWLISEGYGKVFNRKNLSLYERELLNVSMLASLKFKAQLFSHINGAFRCGAEIKTIQRFILNLDYLKNKSFSAFGIKVLNEFLKLKSKD